MSAAETLPPTSEACGETRPCAECGRPMPLDAFPRFGRGTSRYCPSCLSLHLRRGKPAPFTRPPRDKQGGGDMATLGTQPKTAPKTVILAELTPTGLTEGPTLSADLIAALKEQVRRHAGDAAREIARGVTEQTVRDLAPGIVREIVAEVAPVIARATIREFLRAMIDGLLSEEVRP